MKLKKLLIYFLFAILVSFIFGYLLRKELLPWQKVKEPELNLKDESINLLIINPDYFNPIVSKNKYIKDTACLIFEGLTQTSEDLRYDMCLAKIVEPNPDFLSYRVVLEDKIYFHNNEKLTANDVIFTIEQIKKAGDNSIYKYNVDNIYEVNKVNDYEIKVTLKEIDNFLPEKLNFPIISKKFYENKDLFKEKKYIGTGKYKVSEMTDETLILEYNSKYREEMKGNIKEIEVKIINKNIPGFELLKSGETDLADTNTEVGAYGRSAFANKRYNTGIFEGILFNLNNEKVKDKNVRQAILLGINRDEMIEKYLNGYGVKAQTPVNLSSYLYNENLPNYAYNPQRANDVLTNTGWKTSENGVRSNEGVKLNISLLINSDKKEAEDKAQLIKENLHQIGIEVEIISKTSGIYESMVKNGLFDMALTDWALSYYPGVLYSLETKEKNNYSFFSNEEYDYLVYSSKREILQTELKEKIFRMQEILNEELPIAGIYFETSTVYYNKKINTGLMSHMENVYYGIENVIIDS